MHLVQTGLNAWSIAFLTAALWGGLRGESWHPTLGLLASLVAVLAQSVVFALFIGGAKTLKETVKVYRLERSFIDRTNQVYFRIFPWAVAAAAAAVAAAVLGGLAGRSAAFRWTHAVLSLLAYTLQIAAAPVEHRQLRALHLILADLDAAVPPEAERALEAAARASAAGAPLPADPRSRGKAVLTLSALGLLTLFGYRYAAGAPIGAPALILLALPLLAGVGLGIYVLARGAARPGR